MENAISRPAGFTRAQKVGVGVSALIVALLAYSVQAHAAASSAGVSAVSDATETLKDTAVAALPLIALVAVAMLVISFVVRLVKKAKG